jgi:oligoribonuclease NrnB/cAMP/cGMP phosphodiesterase (DHH superfamily)
MSRSGAGMAWDHFHQSTRPPLIDYIEDRDLWAWKLPHSKEILAAFESIRPSFENFNDFNLKLEDPSQMAMVISQGSAIVEYKGAKVRALAEKAYYVDLSAICNLDDPTIQAPCVNTPVFHSEVGNLLSAKHPVVIIWHRAEDGLYRHSLRSADKFDCSKIARFWGGGGHANAAGFTTQEPLPAISRKE